MLDAVTASQLAMEFDQLKMQSISHNVANANTPAFKKQVLEALPFQDLLREKTPVPYQALLERQGSLEQTRQPKDLAISGDGYFQVRNNEGVFYTRRGDFQINQQGELATATGEILLGAHGSIRPDSPDFTVDRQGFVYVDKQQIDRIQLQRFEQPQILRYVGNSLYQTEESPTPTDASTGILQGFIEQSNIKSVEEMMDMMQVARHFEANQRILRTADNLLSTAINQLGEGNV